MQVIGEIPHTECKITVFSWNQKFIVKIEKGLLEQTYKISETDIIAEDLPTLFSGNFMQKIVERFNHMQEDMQKAAADL